MKTTERETFLGIDADTRTEYLLTVVHDQYGTTRTVRVREPEALSWGPPVALDTEAGS